MKEYLKKNIVKIIILAIAILFVAKFAGLRLLQVYVESGVGTCAKIPILCMAPSEIIIIDPPIDDTYKNELIIHNLSKMKVGLPEGFAVTQELIKRPYYKKFKKKDKGAIAYVLYNAPGFLPRLFSSIAKQGIDNNYDFFQYIMYANLNRMNNITDAFFVILKGIFTPNLENQLNVKMAKFTMGDRKGFLNYNLNRTENYFDCNIFDPDGSYFKLYIKDRIGVLDLTKVFTIISTVKKH
ncbi:MAG: hypothetical protein V1650_03495 [Candidatus Omnitrophota bacterium]